MSNKQKAGVRWLDGYPGFFEPAFYKKSYIQAIKAEAIADAKNECVTTVSIFCTIWLENGCDINRWISYNLKSELSTVSLSLDEFYTLKPAHLITLVQQNYYLATAF